MIPGRCTIDVDCRMLPGASPADVEALLRAGRSRATGRSSGSTRELVGGTRSPMDTPLWRSLETWVAQVEPDARARADLRRGLHGQPLPARTAFGTIAYGFFPLRAMDSELAARLVHSADERIPVDDLELGVDALRAAATAWG